MEYSNFQMHFYCTANGIDLTKIRFLESSKLIYTKRGEEQYIKDLSKEMDAVKAEHFSSFMTKLFSDQTSGDERKTIIVRIDQFL